MLTLSTTSQQVHDSHFMMRLKSNLKRKKKATFLKLDVSIVLRSLVIRQQLSF